MELTGLESMQAIPPLLKKWLGRGEGTTASLAPPTPIPLILHNFIMHKSIELVVSTYVGTYLFLCLVPIYACFNQYR